MSLPGLFMLRRAAVLAAPVMAATLIAACGSSGSSPGSVPSTGNGVGGSGSTTPPAAGSPNSCNVITQAEASAALGGQPVKPPIRGKATVEGGVACVYYGPNVPPGVSPNIPVGDSVRVVLVTGPNAKKYFDNYRSHVNAQTIRGLGDAAFYDGFASISVLKGDAYVRIAVGIPNPLPAETKLAEDALPRM